MPNENNPENNNATSTTAPTEKVRTTAQSLMDEVNKLIDGSKETVSKKLTQLLVDREVEFRVSVLENLLKARREAEVEVRKVQPDQKSYDREGKLVAETFSEGQRKKLQEATTRLENLDKAFTAAVENGDFKKAKEMAGKKVENKEEK